MCTHPSQPTSLDGDDLLSYDIQRKLTEIDEVDAESVDENERMKEIKTKGKVKGKGKKNKKSVKKNDRNMLQQMLAPIGQLFQSIVNEIWRGTVIQVESGVTSTSVRPM